MMTLSRMLGMGITGGDLERIMAREKTRQLNQIVVTGASEHNLKHINVTLPRNKLTVITGLSGSGKSSLAFDTIYAEGQRRYVESLSSYARQFLNQMHKPEVEHIDGLSPAISIEQKTVSKNPRSTVGTVTEIYDYLRVLFANLGEPHCPDCGQVLQQQTVQEIVDSVMKWPNGTRIILMAPLVRGRKGEYRQIFEQAEREGYMRLKVDGEYRELGLEVIRLNKRNKHDISVVIDRLVVTPKIRKRLTDSVETALVKSNGLVSIERVGRQNPAGDGGGEECIFSESMACPDHGPQIVELSPRMFSFNNPFGACPQCKGLGRSQEVDLERLVPDQSRSIREGAVFAWRGYFGKQSNSGNEDDIDERGGSWGRQYIQSVLEHFKVDVDRAWKDLPETKKELLLNGSGSKKVHIQYASRRGTKFETKTPWEGIIPRIRRRMKETSSDEIRERLKVYYANRPCEACHGMRLRPESLAVTLRGRNISEFCAMTVDEALRFLEKTRWTAKEQSIGSQLLKEIMERLQFLINVGLNYLSLDRPAATLSGGEGQRIRLATQIGSQLVGVLYILDEPSIGLHHRDHGRLLKMLKHLRDMGNTLIVVEHDESTINEADYVIDLGPGAGRLGGEVVASGTPRQILKSGQSLTADYLSGRRRIPVPAGRRQRDPRRELIVQSAGANNLKNIDVRFPLGLFVCVTGVSGSGKSTLVNDILYRKLAMEFYQASHDPGKHGGITGVKHLDKVVDVDQSPIGRTPRSNPATYTGLYSIIRELFARLPESQVRGYKPGRFSFNVKGGRCESCKGDGLIKIEMHFLPDVYVECEVCRGRRFNRETLEVLYRGKSIADILEMTCDDALDFFHAVPALRQRLETLCGVGLGYIHLGQPATTLSGGEAQRVKLSRELGKRSTGNTLYILDEPTTGLHFEDIRRLVDVLQRLVDEGNSVVIIEHNLDVIKSADWIIDLGPEGGEGGGEIIVAGTPEDVVKAKKSHTGFALRNLTGNA
jgi:excinuclease ABC subunit A